MEPPIPSGTILQNRYHLLSVLGQGGFGRTYLAEDQGRFNERCALKELIPPETGSYELEKSRELFQREAESLYKLNHPQVPQFRANFEQDGRLFLVQDYVEGKTYRELLNDRKAQTYIQSTNPNVGSPEPSAGVFSETEIRQLLLQLLPVLDHIHSKNIIHRDITPDNIIRRSSDGLPVLIDFGVVKELATRIFTSVASAPITTVGKVGYAPSEQIQTGRAYASSDLYSLAATAVVLLTGKEPQALFDDNQLTWNWRRWANVSDALASVLNRMLSYRPGDRYQSATEVMQALQSPSATPQAPVSPPSPQRPDPNLSQVATMAVGRPPEEGAGVRTPQRGNPAIRNPNERTMWDNPVAVLGIGAALALLAGIGSWALFSSLRNTEDPQPSVTPTEPIGDVSPTPLVIETLPPTPVETLSPLPTTTPITIPTTPTTIPTQAPTSYSQRLSLPVGRTTTKSGNLKSNTTVNYIIQGEQNQRLTATIPDEGVLMTVLGPDGKPLNRATRVQRWGGRLPYTGKYTIQLRPVQGLPNSDYTLVMSLEGTKPSPSPSTSPSPSPSPKYDQEKVSLAAGKSVERSGKTSPQLIKRYLVTVPEGQELTVKPVVSDVNINVQTPNGAVQQNAAGVKFVVPGDYKVDVITANEADFKLNISLQNVPVNSTPNSTPSSTPSSTPNTTPDNQP